MFKHILKKLRSYWYLFLCSYHVGCIEGGIKKYECYDDESIKESIVQWVEKHSKLLIKYSALIDSSIDAQSYIKKEWP